MKPSASALSALSFRYRPADTLLHRLSGGSKLFSFVLLTAGLLVTDTLAGYLASVLLLLLLSVCARLPKGALLHSLPGLKSFLAVIFLMNALFTPGEHTCFSAGILQLSVEGILQGAHVVLRVLLLVMLSNILLSVTPSMEITGAIMKLLSPFSRLGLPTGEIAMILSAAMQFIPILLQETASIRMAQSARGAQFRHRNFLKRALSYPPLVLPMFLAAFRRADELSLAMEARGYRNNSCSDKQPAASFSFKDAAAIAFCLGFLLLQAGLSSR